MTRSQRPRGTAQQLSLGLFIAMTAFTSAAPRGAMTQARTETTGSGAETDAPLQHSDQVAQCRARGSLFAYYPPLDRCMPLLDEESPCAQPGEVLALNTTSLQAFCLLLPCGPGQVLLTDGKCHSKSDVCADRSDMELVMEETGYGTCDCRDGEVFWEGTGQCYAAHTRGPCSDREHIVFVTSVDGSDGKGTVQCQPTTCSPGKVLWQGQCVTLDGEGCIDSVHGHFALNPASLEFQCMLRCPDGMAEVNLECFPLYFRGPCKHGEYVEPVMGTRYGRCAQNPCKTDNSLPWNGRCWTEGDVCEVSEDDHLLANNGEETRMKANAHRTQVLNRPESGKGVNRMSATKQPQRMTQNSFHTMLPDLIIPTAAGDLHPTSMPIEFQQSTADHRPTVRRHVDAKNRHQTVRSDTRTTSPASVSAPSASELTTPPAVRAASFASPTPSTQSPSFEPTTPQQASSSATSSTPTTMSASSAPPRLPTHYITPRSSSRRKPTTTQSSLPLHLQYLLGKPPKLHDLAFLHNILPPPRWSTLPPPPPKEGLSPEIREELMSRHAILPPPPPANSAGLLEILNLHAFHGQASEPSRSSVPAPMRAPVQYTYDGKKIDNPLMPLLKTQRRRTRDAHMVPTTRSQHHTERSLGRVSGSIAASRGRHIVVNPETRQVECSSRAGLLRNVRYAHYKCRPGSRRALLDACRPEGATRVDSHPAQCLRGTRYNLLTDQCKTIT